MFIQVLLQDEAIVLNLFTDFFCQIDKNLKYNTSKMTNYTSFTIVRCTLTKQRFSEFL